MAKFILDTCIFRDWAKRKDPVFSKVQQHRAEGIVLPIVAIGEVLYGWHHIARGEMQPKRELQIYESMKLAVDIFQQTTIVPFEHTTQKILRTIRVGRGDRGKCDMRIAAIAIEHDLVLVTNNTKDFTGINGLDIDDWTK